MERPLDLVELRSFLAVASQRSFTQAARQLGLSQPGISRQVQRLEQEFGTALFRRGSRGLELTDAGQRLTAFAREVLDGYDRLCHDFRHQSASIAGELRIAASTTPGEFIVPDLLARFNQVYPLVRPQVFIADSTVVANELAERRWDVGFMGTRLPGRNLHYRVLVEDEVVLAVPRTHPFAGRSEVQLAELEGQPVIEREDGSGTLMSVRAELARRGLPFPDYRTVMVLSTTHAILRAVENGHGIGWLSSLALRGAEGVGVAMVRIAGLPIRRALYLVYEDRRPLPPPAGVFVRWVVDEVSVAERSSSELDG